MNLPKLTDLDLSGKSVIVRLDLDIDNDFSRIDNASETLKYLARKASKVIMIGHKGRPGGKIHPELSLERLVPHLAKVLGRGVTLEKDSEFVLKENLRFNPKEELNDPGFAKELAYGVDVYVNEAFAASHRAHTSIVGIPRLLSHAAGFRFVTEVEYLSRVLENPKRPVVGVISGVKKDKMEFIKNILDKVDRVLVGGRLPEYYGDENPNPEKVLIGGLIADKEDLTIHTVEVFEEEIKKAGTIILAGVPGKYEDEGHRQATKRIFEAIAGSGAYKVAGGGDAEAAITMFKLNDEFDWISSGGGAMLEFLANRTLPGIASLMD